MGGWQIIGWLVRGLRRLRQDLDAHDCIFKERALEREHQLSVFAQEELQPAFDFGDQQIGFLGIESCLGLDPSLEVLDIVAAVEQNRLSDFFDVWVGVGEGFGGFFSAKIFGDCIDLGDRGALNEGIGDCIVEVAIFLEADDDLIFMIRQVRFVDDRSFKASESFGIEATEFIGPVGRQIVWLEPLMKKLDWEPQLLFWEPHVTSDRG